MYLLLLILILNILLFETFIDAALQKFYTHKLIKRKPKLVGKEILDLPLKQNYIREETDDDDDGKIERDIIETVVSHIFKNDK